MQDLVNKMETLKGEKTFLEEYLEGEIYSLTSLWDGKNLLSFPIENLTEVQHDRLELYKTKLNFMLSDEKADFVGFLPQNFSGQKRLVSFRIQNAIG